MRHSALLGRLTNQRWVARRRPEVVLCTRRRRGGDSVLLVGGASSVTSSAIVIPDPLALYHGTTQDAAEAAVASGFRASAVEDRLRALAARYGVDYGALAVEVGEFVWQRQRHDPFVHLATNPRLAASYARRGSEIDHFARQAIWRLQHPTTDKHDPVWGRAGIEWAQAEVARAQVSVVVRVVVPHTELPADKLKTLEKMCELLGGSQGATYLGEEVLLLPAVASRYVAGIDEVEPCACWRDGKCDVCQDWNRRPGGWDGTFH